MYDEDNSRQVDLTEMENVMKVMQKFIYFLYKISFITDNQGFGAGGSWIRSLKAGSRSDFGSFQ